jgi:carboxymethylenebutenolidase
MARQGQAWNGIRTHHKNYVNLARPARRCSALQNLYGDMVMQGDLSAAVIGYPNNGETAEAYLARPAGDTKRGGVVVIHHMPGWDEWTAEVCRKLAHHGYDTIAPHLYFRLGKGSPDDLAAKARAEGGVSDDQVIADVAACMEHLRKLPSSNGKVGVIGFCSGGRHTYLAGGRLKGIDALVDCWGGNVIVDDPTAITDKRPVAPIDYTENITAPLLGIFGNEDPNPNPDQVNRTEEKLKALGKTYEFERYDGVGHGFFAHYRPAYRAAQASDGWAKVLAFFQKHLS